MKMAERFGLPATFMTRPRLPCAGAEEREVGSD
jgi:hypothetical protein